MEKTAVIYTRVSTDDQKNFGFSLDEQKERIESFCKKNGIKILRHYQDDCSAKSFNRPEFNRFLQDLKEKILYPYPDFFICVRLDRFSRDAAEAIMMARHIKKKYNITIKFVENNANMDTPEGFFIYLINAGLAQIENDRRGENTKAGMRQAKKAGRWVGTPPNGYSFIRENNISKLVFNKQKELVIESFDEMSKGIFSTDELRKRMNKKGLKCSKNQFYNLLQNKVYIGKITIPKNQEEPEITVQGLHDPLITEELFNKVQDILHGRKKPNQRIGNIDEDFPLRGHLLCPICNKQITGSKSQNRIKKKYAYYHCQKCKKVRYRADKLNSDFCDFLTTFQTHPEVTALYYSIFMDVYSEDYNKRSNMKKDMEKEMSEFVSKRDNAMDMFFGGKINKTDYDVAKMRYDDKISEIEQKMSALRTNDKNIIRYIQFGLSFFRNVSEYYIKAPLNVKHKILCSIFPEKIIFDGKGYRTQKEDELINLLFSMNKGFEKKKVSKIADLSCSAPPAGLEPATL